MDTPQNAAVEEQAIDRIHRIGQLRPVTVKRLVMQVRTYVVLCIPIVLFKTCNNVRLSTTVSTTVSNKLTNIAGHRRGANPRRTATAWC